MFQQPTYRHDGEMESSQNSTQETTRQESTTAEEERIRSELNAAPTPSLLNMLRNPSSASGVGASMRRTIVDFLVAREGADFVEQNLRGPEEGADGAPPVAQQVASGGDLEDEGVMAFPAMAPAMSPAMAPPSVVPSVEEPSVVPYMEEVSGNTTRYGFCKSALSRIAGDSVANLLGNEFGEAAVEHGLLSPAADLRLNDPIRRCEAAVVVTRAFGIEPLNVGEIRRVFKDLASTHWAGPFVYGCVLQGVLSGYGDETFKPEDGLEFQYLEGFLDRASSPPGEPAETAFDPREEWGARSILNGKPATLSQTRWAYSLDPEAHATRDASGEQEDRVEQTNAIVDGLRASSSNRYQPRGRDTYCNVFAHDFAYLMGAFVPRCWWTKAAISHYEKHGEFPPIQYGNNVTTEMRANQMLTWFQEWGHRFGWSHLGDVAPSNLTKAQNLANDGRVVVVVGSTGTSASGHVAGIIPETDTVKATKDADGNVTRPIQSQAGRVPVTRGPSAWFSGTYRGGKGIYVHG